MPRRGCRCTFMLWYRSERWTRSTSSHTPCSSSSCGRGKAKPSLITEQTPRSAGALRGQDLRDLQMETVPQSFSLR